MKSKPKCVDCGNEEDEEALRLARHWYKYRPDWILLGEDEPIRCYGCWKIHFAEYLSAGFSLEASGVWSDIFDSRVDVAVSWRNAGFTDENITPWTEYFEEPSLAASWRDLRFSLIEAREWSEVCTRAEDAATWRKEGFSFHLDPSWIKWGVTIDEIKACIANDERKGTLRWFSETYAPDIEYKTEYGLTFQEAVFCLNNNLFAYRSIYKWHHDQEMLEYWKPIGLSLREIVELRREICGDESELFDIHDELRFKIKNWKPEIWEFLPKFCDELRKAGVPITYENLVKYWGLSGPQILKAIDMGTEVKLASKIVRSGIPASKAKIVELLIAKGIDQDSALLLTKRGFSIRTVNQIEKWGYSIWCLVGLVEQAKTLGATEIKQWLLCEDEWGTKGSSFGWDRQIIDWHQYGFTPGEALKWFQDGFRPSEAYAWSESGAKTPTIAKRRKEAGITPKTD